jgi:penicillin-insensitive murein endopeptidase
MSPSRFVAIAVACGFACVAENADAEPTLTFAARLERSPYSLMSLSVGTPSRGWQLRAKKLEESPRLKIRPGSRENVYGHPALVHMLHRSADEMARLWPGTVMLIGDLSSRDGGPLAGHRSHQSGRDADIALYARDGRGQPVNPGRFLLFDEQGRAKGHPGLYFDEARNWALVLSWLADGRARVTHVFVAQWLRERLLAYGRTTKQRHRVEDVARLLSQPKGVSEHADHFHVRIACPDGQGGICDEDVPLLRSVAVRGFCNVSAADARLSSFRTSRIR